MRVDILHESRFRTRDGVGEEVGRVEVLLEERERQLQLAQHLASAFSIWALLLKVLGG